MRQPLIFKTSKNFKRGLFIMNRYRPSDMVIILSTIAFSVLSIILYLNLVDESETLIKLIIVGLLLLPVLAVYLLFMPMPTYFNVLDFLKVWVRWQFKQKVWKWEGIHQFDYYEIDDDQEGEEHGKPDKRIRRKKNQKKNS